MSGNSERTGEASAGSATVTLNSATPIIKLRGSHGSANTKEETAPKSQIKWKDDVVDNENMNKKKSKICCIFHPQTLSDDEEEEEKDGEQAHEHKTCNHDHKKDDDEDDSSSSDEDEGGDYESRKQKRLERRMKNIKEKASKPYEPANAYEIQPDYSHLRNKK